MPARDSVSNPTPIVHTDASGKNAAVAATTPPQSGVWITTYTSMREQGAQLAQAGFDLLVFDESHKLKTYGAEGGSAQAAAAEVVFMIFEGKTPGVSDPSKFNPVVQRCVCPDVVLDTGHDNVPRKGRQ